jgi:Tfp pilus assembly protein PilX
MLYRWRDVIRVVVLMVVVVVAMITVAVAGMFIVTVRHVESFMNWGWGLKAEESGEKRGEKIELSSARLYTLFEAASKAVG